MRRLISVGALLLLVVLVFGVGQVVLPGIAASTLRSRLSRNGKVLSVQVSAFPAIELLWHQADTVVGRMASSRSGTGHLDSLLEQAGDVGTLNASVGTFNSGLLTLHNVSLRKQGDELMGQGTLLEGDLRAAIPVLQSVSFVSDGSEGLTLSGTGSFLGVTATVPATVQPQAGRLVLRLDVPLLSVASFTVFSDPHLSVQEVSGAAIPGGLSVAARARLR